MLNNIGNGKHNSSWSPVHTPSPPISNDATASVGGTAGGMNGTMTNSSSFMASNNISNNRGQFMSFPTKQSTTTSFSPAATAGTGMSMSSTTSNNTGTTQSQSNFSFKPNASTSPAFGQNTGGLSFSRQTTPSLETRNPFVSTSSFQSPSISLGGTVTPSSTATNFQPNSFLSRPSPKSSSSPSNSFFTQSFNHDLGGSTAVGLRRRVNTGGTSNNSTSISSSRLPPLPNTTRIGTASLDLPDDFKENLNHKKFDGMNKQHYSNSILKTSQNNSPSPLLTISPHNITTNTTTSISTQRQIENYHPSSQTSNNNSTLNMTEFSSTSYSCWVIIYGFTNSIEYRTIMANFQSYGTILDAYPSTLGHTKFRDGNHGGSSSNWVCVHYKSSIQADKALCQDGSLIHIVGSDNDTTNDNTGSNYISNTNQIRSSVQQDKIVVLGVMKMNESLAMKLGLKNYLETGNTGVDKICDSSSLKIQSKVDHKADPADNVSKKNTVRFASSVLNEDDILLFANETKQRQNEENGNQQGGTNIIACEKSSICGKVLAWFFSW